MSVYQPPQRTPIDRARSAMGYVAAAQREGCANCAHVLRLTPTQQDGRVWALRCTRGEFGTWPMAWCRLYERQSTPPPR